MIRKLTIGQDHYFQWNPPQGLSESTPTLTINWPAGSTNYVMAAWRANDVVTAISADRKFLTCTWGSGAMFSAFSQGEPQPAYLDVAGKGQIPVRVLRLSAVDTGSPTTIGTLELAEPLPHSVLMTGTPAATLVWPTWVVLVPASDIPAAQTRPILWKTTYKVSVDDYSPGTYLTDRGELAAVKAPFDTGLTDSQLLKIFPGLSAAFSQGQASWREQIQSGLDLLLGRLLPELPEGMYEDNLAGSQWLRAHALATSIVILSDLIMRGVDRKEALLVAEAQLDQEIKLRLARKEWIDLNSDGVIDEAEVSPSSALLGMIRSHVTDASVMDLSSELGRTPDPYVRFRVTGDR